MTSKTWETREIEYQITQFRTAKLSVPVLTDGDSDHDMIAVTTRYGNETHIAYIGSSVTHCGCWMKVTSLSRATRKAEVTCEKCRKYI
jgi:hypothetical protein